MGRINVLPRHIAELIAAGEVVERPSSVVKEIMENSIDAGSKNVTIEIKHGGITYIRITDDGCGMDAEDVRKAFISHATSKIATEEDLAGIGTLGFRGEALASIAAVAKVEVMTRPDGDVMGTRYSIEGGEEKELSEAGCPAGTTLIIRDIFYNTPARMKFLKKDVTEGNSVAGVVDRIALSHPEVSIRFIRDGKQQLLTPGNGRLGDTIYAIFGREFAMGLLPVDYNLSGVGVRGYISKPVASRANRAMQFFFINGRLVKSVTAMSAMENAYRDSIMIGKFPACVLHLTMPNECVDVNVHPAKTEVRFANEKQVYEAVYYAVKSCLSKDFSKPEVRLSQSSRQSDLLKPPVKEQKGEQIRMTAAEFREKFTPQAENKKERTFFDEKPVKSENTFVPEKKKEIPKAEPLNEKLTEKPKNFSVSDSLKAEYKSNNSADEPVSTLSDYYKKLDLSKEKKSQPEEKVQAVKNVVNPPEAPVKEQTSEPDLQKIKEAPAVEKEPSVPTFRIVGEAFKTYIFVECEGELLIVDKHAAHERMIYEKLKREAEHFSQVLLKPVTITLSKEEYSVIMENLEEFSKAGFSVEDFGFGTVIVRETPMDLDSESITEIVCELAAALASNKIDVRSSKTDWLYHSVACRSAIKAGDATTDYEMKKFIGELLKNPDIKYCPHGRPVMIKMTRNELEKSFGRIQ
mgnify:FL=1